MTTKHINRKIRVLRLLAIVQAYNCYTMTELYRKILQFDSSWKDAEHLSNWMDMLMPYKEHSPTDFLYDKDEFPDMVLSYHDEFKKWMKIAEQVGISEKTLTAFCKNVDNLQSVFRLKVFGHILYPEWLSALFLYLNDTISKTELQITFFEYSLFTGKAKPANLAQFRKTILEIERIILEIANKQICRSIRNQDYVCNNKNVTFANINDLNSNY
jgi:hypothetical protein